MKQRESLKLKESTKNAKQKPRDHHRSRYSSCSLAPLATNSFELKLAKTAINEHTITLVLVLYFTSVYIRM